MKNDQNSTRSLLALMAIQLLLMLGCTREIDPKEFPGASYFPIELGKVRIYYVEDSTYRAAQTSGISVRRYYKKEVVSGFETDLLGREVAVLDIFESPDSLGSAYQWTFARRDQQYLGTEHAERIENNTRYLSLRLPGHPHSNWNGNLYNDLGVENWTYASTDTTLLLGGKSYPRSLYVLQVPYWQPVEQRGLTYFKIEHAYEAYAPGIGKILKYRKFLEEQNGNPNPNSFVYYEYLVDHD
jgi:hypothetical protein